jgi:hypothetical protein
MVLAVAIAMAGAPRLPAIETGYGEDPVPDTYRSLRPPYSAYGMDPIPVKSPLERWQEFRAYRQQQQQFRPRRPSYPTGEGWKFWRHWR